MNEAARKRTHNDSRWFSLPIAIYEFFRIKSMTPTVLLAAAKKTCLN